MSKAFRPPGNDTAAPPDHTQQVSAKPPTASEVMARGCMVGCLDHVRQAINMGQDIQQPLPPHDLPALSLLAQTAPPHQQTMAIAAALLAAGADPASQDCLGQNAFQRAICGGNVKECFLTTRAPLLLMMADHQRQQGRPAWPITKEGRTLVHTAVYSNISSLAITWLVHQGLDPVAADADGNTPLHTAFRWERGEAAGTLKQLITQSGQTIEHRNHHNQLPEDLIVRKGKSKHEIDAFLMTVAMARVPDLISKTESIEVEQHRRPRRM